MTTVVRNNIRITVALIVGIVAVTSAFVRQEQRIDRALELRAQLDSARREIHDVKCYLQPHTIGCHPPSP